MIEVLMLLAVFATNILKPISKVLEDYDGLMSLAELIIEGLFLFFVLKEFKMTRKSFEWQNEEWRNRKDDEATKRINMITRALVIDYLNDFSFCEKLHKNIGKISELYNKIEINKDKRRLRMPAATEDEIKVWNDEVKKLSDQFFNEFIPLQMEDLIDGYKKKYNNGNDISQGEIEILKNIHNIVFMNPYNYVEFKYLFEGKIRVYAYDDIKYFEHFRDFTKNIPETIIGTDIIRKIKIDYKSLEKMYDKMFFGKYDC